MTTFAKSFLVFFGRINTGKLPPKKILGVDFDERNIKRNMVF